MKNKWLYILAALLLSLPLQGLSEAEPRIILYFFHSNPCEACHEVDNLYRIIDETGAGAEACLVVEEYREYTTSFRAETEAVVQWFSLEHAPQTPFLVAGNTLLEGYDAIQNGINTAVSEAAGSALVFSEDSVAKYGSLKAALSDGKVHLGRKLAASGAGLSLLCAIAIQRRLRKSKNHPMRPHSLTESSI